MVDEELVELTMRTTELQIEYNFFTFVMKYKILGRTHRFGTQHLPVIQ